MTKALVALLEHARGGARLALAATIGILLPIAVAVDAVGLLLRDLRRRRVLAATDARCPAGHQVSLIGGWECESCKAGFDGHGFDRCPSCGAVAARASCACGRYAANPLFSDEDAP